MRLWSISPKYLDRQGLLAVWREGLLAKHVLEGKTKGYKNHPQLLRLKESKDTLSQINNYLLNIYQKAETRGYKFSLEKLDGLKKIAKHITVSTCQVAYEFEHLLNKLKIRDTERYKKYKNTKDIEVHNLFEVVAGKIEKWEKIK